jgi:hypothetical protein
MCKFSSTGKCFNFLKCGISCLMPLDVPFLVLPLVLPAERSVRWNASIPSAWLHVENPVRAVMWVLLQPLAPFLQMQTQYIPFFYIFIQELCTWACEHKKCSKLCRELCDREPCDEPCRKKLKCGHDCVSPWLKIFYKRPWFYGGLTFVSCRQVGFCSEPCPPLCRICDKVQLTEFVLYGFEEEEDAR